MPGRTRRERFGCTLHCRVARGIGHRDVRRRTEETARSVVMFFMFILSFAGVDSCSSCSCSCPRYGRSTASWVNL